MAVLNITYNGVSFDHPLHLDERVTDADVRRIAVELLRSGDVRGLQIAHLSDRAFDDFVVDRLASPSGESRIYLRPKVPFGAEGA
jgi:hypothetical protein